jgi:hypothetical protein
MVFDSALRRPTHLSRANQIESPVMQEKMHQALTFKFSKEQLIVLFSIALLSFDVRLNRLTIKCAAYELLPSYQ